MPRAVLFDLFNTLVPGGDNGERDLAYTRMAAVLGVNRAAYRQAFEDSWPERSTGKLGDLSATIRQLAVRAGGSPTPGQVAHAVALRRALTAGLIGRVSAGTLAVLDALRAGGWRLGLVSNATHESPDAFHHSLLADRFSTAAFSCVLGVAKPDPAIYLAACAGLGLAPDSCVYVGDGADRELVAASALGMRVIRTTEHVQSDPGWVGPTVRTLAELVTELPRPRGQPPVAGEAARPSGTAASSAVDRREVPGVRWPGDQQRRRLGKGHRGTAPA
jgi:putative hydrolase of the HAD superfamily